MGFSASHYVFQGNVCVCNLEAFHSGVTVFYGTDWNSWSCSSCSIHSLVKSLMLWTDKSGCRVWEPKHSLPTWSIPFLMWKSGRADHRLNFIVMACEMTFLVSLLELWKKLTVQAERSIYFLNLSSLAVLSTAIYIFLSSASNGFGFRLTSNSLCSSKPFQEWCVYISTQP